MTLRPDGEVSSRHSFRTKFSDPITVWLNSLPEGEKSFHLRAALRLYKQTLDRNTAIPSGELPMAQVPRLDQQKNPEVKLPKRQLEKSKVALENIEEKLANLKF